MDDLTPEERAELEQLKDKLEADIRSLGRKIKSLQFGTGVAGAEKVIAAREGTGDRPPCETCDHWWPTKGDFGDCHGGLPVLAPELARAEGLPSNIGWWPVTHKSEGCAQHQDFYLQFARKGSS